MLTRLLHRTKGYVKDRYRLVFLDPVTGSAVPTGPDSDGYRLELTKQWLIDHRKTLNDGIKVVKMAAAAGRLAGLPLPATVGLPSEIVSKAEVRFPVLFAGGTPQC